jgi:hypothetical protein
MKGLIVAAMVIVMPPNGQVPKGWPPSFHKDSCGKFLQSESLVQGMYLAWASSHIRRKFSVRFASADLLQPLRTYCTANPSSLFADATEAVEPQVAAVPKSN